MPIITRDQFASAARQKSGRHEFKGVLNEVRTYSISAATTSLFLCHAHVDMEAVAQARLFFENLGINIYVDWADKTMPEKPDASTATNIKNQIITQNDKFIMLATNNALASKWCNWEIGIADPFKNPKNKMALFPMADNNGSWQGNEYLQIYPTIEQGNINKNDYYVWHQGTNPELLETWLSKK